MITIDDKKIIDFTLDDKNVVKIQDETTLKVLWEKVEPIEPDYFYIESLGDGNTVSVINVGNGTTKNVTHTLEYSTDKNTWDIITYDWAYGTHTTEIPVKLNTGEKMYFRNDTRLFSNLSSKYISFSPSVSSNVGGDIRTLSNYLDVDNETKPQSYMFYYLFYNNKYIVDASNLKLPYTTLESNCYTGIFRGCTSLTSAPTELPATTLAHSCYYELFRDCTSLTTAPELPATTLSNFCYNNIFYGCSKLNNVTVYANDISASGCITNWLRGVASTGTFNNYGSATYIANSPSGIPDGWTEVTPEIQSITANPDTFTIKSQNTRVNCTSILTITTTTGITITHTNTATITVGENTGDSTRTLIETIPYKGSSYQVTIVQTANDVKPTCSQNVVSTGTYPFELNSNDYYESTNKGQSSSYSYATLNYEGFDELVLECINFAESNYDYGIISQPDVQLSESTKDDGATGSTNVFHNFQGQSSENPVQLTIPSDEGSHFITIKFRKDSSSAEGNDSLQFKVIEP